MVVIGNTTCKSALSCLSLFDTANQEHQMDSTNAAAACHACFEYNHCRLYYVQVSIFGKERTVVKQAFMAVHAI